VELFQTLLVSAEDKVEPVGYDSSILLKNADFNLIVVLKIKDFGITDHVQSNYQMKNNTPLNNNLRLFSKIETVTRWDLV